MNRRTLPNASELDRFDGYKSYDQKQMLHLISRNMEIIRREQQRGSRLDPTYLRDLEEEYEKLVHGTGDNA